MIHSRKAIWKVFSFHFPLLLSLYETATVCSFYGWAGWAEKTGKKNKFLPCFPRHFCYLNSRQNPEPSLGKCGLFSPVISWRISDWRTWWLDWEYFSCQWFSYRTGFTIEFRFLQDLSQEAEKYKSRSLHLSFSGFFARNIILREIRPLRKDGWNKRMLRPRLWYGCV